ncbi:LysR family transcriptional regulator [Actinoplanes sp. DH11]|uniref:LysR family transcriptional regulator n=1 Tax=Actinoplanes sp. DH11 TaxID=2857011 RepID=UPI001E59127D|nr:LysR family transcriptional regulator [Actinoplanes sp. DH11]
MTVDVRHLRAFLAIATTGGITRAAATLHVTQPALSRTLRQLENHLGVRLIDRSTHHLRLTAAGQAYRPRAAAAVAAVDEALDPSRAGTWPLRLGHAWCALGEHTTTLLRRWKQDHPHTPLDLLRIDERDAGLTRGAVDVAIIRGPASTAALHAAVSGAAAPGAAASDAVASGAVPSGAVASGAAGRVRTLALTTEARIAAVPSDSPLATRTRLTLADLLGELIAVNTVAGITDLSLWPPGAAPAGTVEVTNTDDWQAAVIAGRAVGVTSTATPLMYAHPAITYIPMPDAPAVTVHLAWTDPPSHPAVPTLVTLAQQVIPRSP